MKKKTVVPVSAQVPVDGRQFGYFPPPRPPIYPSYFQQPYYNPFFYSPFFSPFPFPPSYGFGRPPFGYGFGYGYGYRYESSSVK